MSSKANTKTIKNNKDENASNSAHRMCNYGMKCKIYKACRALLKKNQEPTEYMLTHMKKYGHIKIAICQYHEKSIEGSKCTHIHLGDTDKIKGKLCRYDKNCRNPICKFYHGWMCPYGIHCRNTKCPLVHPYLYDVKGNAIEDGRRHSISDEFFGNKKEESNKKDSSKIKTRLNIQRPNDKK